MEELVCFTDKIVLEQRVSIHMCSTCLNEKFFLIFWQFLKLRKGNKRQKLQKNHSTRKFNLPNHRPFQSDTEDLSITHFFTILDKESPQYVW